jgi:hypothetical protein
MEVGTQDQNHKSHLPSKSTYQVHLLLYSRYSVVQ